MLAARTLRLSILMDNYTNEFFLVSILFYLFIPIYSVSCRLLIFGLRYVLFFSRNQFGFISFTIWLHMHHFLYQTVKQMSLGHYQKCSFRNSTYCSEILKKHLEGFLSISLSYNMILGTIY
ncbi:hypothetical protein QTP88_005446 [Uroleucon formosanum]